MDPEHGSKGLCQERAFVSGLQAANYLIKGVEGDYDLVEVLPVRDNEVQFKLAAQVNSAVMKYLPRFWVR